MKYDTTLKALFQNPPLRLLETLLGQPVTECRLLPTELPLVENLRADLLLQLPDERIFHFELHAWPDKRLPRRMLRYWDRTEATHGSFPVQVVLWVGPGPPNLEDGIDREELRFRYRIVDVKEIDAEFLIDSPEAGECVFAILCRLPDSRAAAVRILNRIAALPPQGRQDALAQLLLLCGLRGLSTLVVEEIEKMPITFDIHENEFLEKIYQEAKQEGRQEGRQQGRREGELVGRVTEARQILSRLLSKRFGPLSPEVLARLENADTETLEAWTLRLVEASELTDIF